MKPLKCLVIIFIVLCTFFITFFVKAMDVSAPKFILITKEVFLSKFESRDDLYQEIAVSPDNKRVAYLDSDGTSGWYIVNGTPGRKYDIKYFSIAGCSFSPDSKHLVYTAGTKENNNFFVIDNNEGPVSFSSIGYPIFSPSDKQLAFIGRDNKSKKSVLFLNWKKYGEFDRIINFGFSADEKRFGIVVRNNHKEFLVLDGNEGKYYDSVVRFMFSKDSQHYIYEASLGNKGFIVRDGIEISESNSLESSIFNPELSHTACIHKEGDKKYVVVDGEQGEKYDEITDLKFSPDGKRYAYAAWTDAGSDRYMCVVLDGKEQKNYRWIMNITFSPDSKRLAYIAGLKGGWSQCVVVDGIEGKNILQVLEKNYNISPPVFSSDSKHYGYVVEMGNEAWMVVDGIEGRHYNQIRKETADGWNCKWDKSFAFGPDGKIAYWAKKGSEWVVVVDGIESKGYQRYIEDCKILFEGPNLLSFVAYRDNQIFRVELEIKQQ